MHPIKRFFLIGLFSLGTIGGFAHGFAHVGACHAARRDAFEDHVADVCTRSAERVFEERAAGAVAAAPAATTSITIHTSPGAVSVDTTAAPAVAAPVAP